MTNSSDQDIALLNAAYRYALSLSASHSDAEDLVHDAWIKLIRNRKYTIEKPLLYRTIRNLYIDRYRRSRKFPEVEFQDADQGVANLEGDQTDYLVSASEMDELLGRLRDQERETLYLSVVEGYTADEIAGLTNRARGTVLSQIHRAKNKLKQFIARRENLSEDRQQGKHDTVIRLADRGRRS